MRGNESVKIKKGSFNNSAINLLSIASPHQHIDVPCPPCGWHQAGPITVQWWRPWHKDDAQKPPKHSKICRYTTQLLVTNRWSLISWNALPLLHVEPPPDHCKSTIFEDKKIPSIMKFYVGHFRPDGINNKMTMCLNHPQPGKAQRTTVMMNVYCSQQFHWHSFHSSLHTLTCQVLLMKRWPQIETQQGKVDCMSLTFHNGTCHFLIGRQFITSAILCLMFSYIEHQMRCNFDFVPQQEIFVWMFYVLVFTPFHRWKPCSQ